MKTYRGRRLPITMEDWIGLGFDEGEVTPDMQRLTKPVVTVTIEETGFTYALPHHVLHSPDGFEWGYGGSGPAELARSILLDYFGAIGNESPRTLPEVPSYQDFKMRFIAGAPKDGFEVTSEQINGWLVDSEVAVV